MINLQMCHQVSSAGNIWMKGLSSYDCFHALMQAIHLVSDFGCCMRMRAELGLASWRRSHRKYYRSAGRMSVGLPNATRPS